MPAARTASADARHQRRLGPDDDQVDAELVASAATSSPDIGSTSWSVATRLHAGVAGGRVHLGHRGIAVQRRGQCVLAAAGADDKGLHVS